MCFATGKIESSRFSKEQIGGKALYAIIDRIDSSDR
jgi:hypothetical protein